MKTLRTYSNLAEAGFASSLLESAGIRAFLAEEQAYTIGYGAGASGLRLQVEEADFERARSILDQESNPDRDEETPPAEALEPVVPAPRGGFPIAVFLAGGAVLGLLILLSRGVPSRPGTNPHSDERRYERDFNRDGQPDHFYTYRGGRLASVEVDRNYDGRIDEWQSSDRDGVVERLELDENFDGQPDVVITYRDGLPALEKRDTDFNGKWDWTTTYENGLQKQADCTPNESPVVVRRYFFTHGILSEEWVDENQDGKFDYRIVHDPFGARSEKQPFAPGD